MTPSRATTTAVADRLWDAVIDGDENLAAETVEGALAGGLPEEALLLDVIAPVQARIGAEWAANRISVAQEHAATAINERVVAHLAHRRRALPAPQRPEPRGRVTVACVDGEWHAFPARIVAEVLQLHGWRVDFLGARMPTPHLVSHLHRTDPRAVLLSGSIPLRLPAAHAAITACRSAGVPVLAGGRAFGPDGRYARILGADGWAPDARGALRMLEEGLPRPGFTAPRGAVEDLPHLADQEYALVGAARPRLVRQTLDALESRYAPMRDYTEEQRERTAEDLAHIVDFLTAALYVDDDALFTEFLTWTGQVLAARGVPPRSLLLTLDVLGDLLGGFPRATGLLTRSAAAVARTWEDPAAPRRLPLRPGRRRPPVGVTGGPPTGRTAPAT